MKYNIENNSSRNDEYTKNLDRNKILKNLITADTPLIFDIGANKGTTISDFKNIWMNCRIHCFEPQFECWESLENLEKKYEGSLMLNKTAVGSKDQKNVSFFSHEITTEQSGFYKINAEANDSILLKKMQSNKEIGRYINSINHERFVDVIRLDTYMKNNGIDNIDLLKIDTQGHEPEMLEGLGDKLQNTNVVLTELMFFDYYERSLSFSDLEKFLLPAGFKFFDISHISKNPMNGRTDWVDLIYVNENFNY